MAQASALDALPAMTLELLGQQPFAVALVDPDSLAIVYCNPLFYAWSEGSEAEPPASLRAALPTLDPDKLAKRMGRRGAFKHADTARIENEARRFPVEYTFAWFEYGDQKWLNVTGHDRSPVHAKELMLQSYSTIIEKHTRTVERQKRALAELLDNMRQGIFTVDDAWWIQGPVSRYSDALFGTTLEGKNLWETLLKDIDPNSDLSATIDTVMTVAIGEDELQWMLVSEELPTHIMWRDPDGDLRKLKVAWCPIWDEEGLLKRIMLVVEDVTEVERLEATLKAEREAQDRRLELLQELADLDRSMLEGFFPAAAEALKRGRQAIEAHWPPTAETINRLFRELHTLKGNAKALQLSAIATAAHEAEGIAARVRDGETHRDLLDKLREGMQGLERTIGEYNALALRVFGIHDAFQETLADEIHVRAIKLSAALQRRNDSEALGLATSLQEMLRGMGESETAREHLGAVVDQLREEIPKPARLTLCARSALHHVMRFSLKPRHQLVPEGRSWSGLHRALLNFTDALTRDPVEGALGAHELGEHARSLQLSHLAHLSTLCEQAIRNGQHALWRATLCRIWRFAGWLAGLRGCQLSLEGQTPRRALLDLEMLHPIEQARWLTHFGQALPESQSLSEWLAAGDPATFCVGNVEATLRGELDPKTLLRGLASEADTGSAIARITTLLLWGEPLDALGEGYLIKADVIFLLQQLRQAAGRSSSLPRMVPVIEHHLKAVERCLHEGGDLPRAVIRLFELPAGVLSRPFSPLVSDTARTLNKDVSFDFIGADVAIHRDRMGPLQDALVHLLRNAVDHGIEDSETRKLRGKPSQGAITLKFSRTPSDLHVEVHDDGGGVDAEQLKARSVARGLLSAEDAISIDEEALLALVFAAGVSTAEQVSEVSGRGVGLDVALSNIKQLGGDISIKSAPGQGTTFSISLPA
ncbi:MAG: ATP-binding protein [Bradymonadia bacterium]